jgi:acyl-CoA thioesterase I
MTEPDIRICFLGDSFVNGTGDETYLGWTGRLCAAAKTLNHSLTYYNLGIRRNTSTDILQRWEQECTRRLPDFCDARMVLSCGVNDMVIEEGRMRVSIEKSRENVQQILRSASAKYKTVMIGPAPVGDSDLNIRLKNLSEAYAQEAGALGISFIEIFSHLISDQTYLLESKNNDGYHPRSYGYSAITDIISSSNEWWFKQIDMTQKV